MAEIATRTMRFGSLQIRYDDRVLEPRPWTTAQSAWAAELIEQAPEGDADARAGHHLVPGGAAVLQLGTLEQVSALGDRVAEGGVLRTGEVRKHDGGVLVRLDRMA